MNKITVATFNDVDKAKQLQAILGRAGIHADVYDESNLQKFWFMSRPLAAHKVQVAETDHEAAKEKLGELDDSQGVMAHAVKCPQCHSGLVEYPQFTRKFITTTLVELACATHLVDKQFYCEECHFTWPAKERIEPKRDILGWPTGQEPELVGKE